MRTAVHSRWILASLAVLVVAPPGARASQESRAKESARLVERQQTRLVDATEFLIEKSRTESGKDGASRTIPEWRVWRWTTAEEVEKAAKSVGCTFPIAGSLIEQAPPAIAPVVRRSTGSHDRGVRCARGEFSFPDSYRSVSSISVDGRAFAVSMELCPDHPTRAAALAEGNLPDPCMRLVRRVVSTHSKPVRQLFDALISDEKARARFKLAIDELARDAPTSVWIRTAERTESPVADSPLSGPPMLYAQLDATMWLDVSCCGQGPVILRISGCPASKYDEVCTAAEEWCRKRGHARPSKENP